VLHECHQGATQLRFLPVPQLFRCSLGTGPDRTEKAQKEQPARITRSGLLKDQF